MTYDAHFAPLFFYLFIIKLLVFHFYFFLYVNIIDT